MSVFLQQEAARWNREEGSSGARAWMAEGIKVLANLDVDPGALMLKLTNLLAKGFETGRWPKLSSRGPAPWDGPRSQKLRRLMWPLGPYRPCDVYTLRPLTSSAAFVGPNPLCLEMAFLLLALSYL